MNIWTVAKQTTALKFVGNSFLTFELAKRDIERIIDDDRGYYTAQGATYVATPLSTVHWIGAVTYSSGSERHIRYTIYQRTLVGSALHALAECAE